MAPAGFRLLTAYLPRVGITAEWRVFVSRGRCNPKWLLLLIRVSEMKGVRLIYPGLIRYSSNIDETR